MKRMIITSSSSSSSSPRSMMMKTTASPSGSGRGGGGSTRAGGGGGGGWSSPSKSSTRSNNNSTSYCCGLSRNAMTMTCIMIVFLCCCLLLPIAILESLDTSGNANEVFAGIRNHKHFLNPSTSVHNLMNLAHRLSYHHHGDAGVDAGAAAGGHVDGGGIGNNGGQSSASAAIVFVPPAHAIAQQQLQEEAHRNRIPSTKNTSTMSTQQQQPKEELVLIDSRTGQEIKNQSISFLSRLGTDSNKKYQKIGRKTKDGRIMRDIQYSELLVQLDPNSIDDYQKKPIGRGVAGLPIQQTLPGLQGAKRAHIQCTEEDPKFNVDPLAYWNDPIGQYDETFLSPFAVTSNSAISNTHTKSQQQQQQPYYLTFVPDRGGWNNIRMSMEIIFIIATLTQRILVLPPKEPFYLMHGGQQYRSFGDFFPIHTKSFGQHVQIITFEEFIQKEMIHQPNNSRITIPLHANETIYKVMDHCDHGADRETSCRYAFQFLRQIGYSYRMDRDDTCLIFDEHMFTTGELPNATILSYIKTTCGPKRNVTYWTKALNDPVILHFPLNEDKYRLLTHFYAIMHFTNPMIDNHIKRFVRDQLHYHDSIYCVAGKIVKAIQIEGFERGFTIDNEGAGGYSALHVRRGDLQFKEVKINASAWYNNTKEVWLPKEILYIATDERNKSFFDDIQKHHDLRYLDDYWDLAGLGNLDPSYLGMIDTIVASRARAFAGTWFSTFTGYINRLRGYHGMSMMDSWYSYLPRKTALHEWKIVATNAYAYEWQDAWIGIDGNNWPSHDKF